VVNGKGLNMMSVEIDRIESELNHKI